MSDQFTGDQGWRGPFSSGTAPGESQGRMGGGGWVDGPMPVSVDEGKGVWPAPIGDDPESYQMRAVPAPQQYEVHGGDRPGGSIETMVEGWPDVFES